MVVVLAKRHAEYAENNFLEAHLACAGSPTRKNCSITCLATMLSESLLCHTTAVEVSLCFVL